uniref:Alpha-1,2-fucosyltransferase n=1 Tax=Panagrolaimus sp. JU765 TaxID=591449 RepID=A0AC34Q3F9_9BILA
MLESKEDFVMPAIKLATKFLKDRDQNLNLSTVIFGNDPEFIKNLPLDKIGHLQKVYYPKSQSRGEDMCFAIKYCDSMVLTASGSTFGWWISYLMKPGSHIFYNSQITDFANHSKDMHDFDIFPPHWHMLTVENDEAKLERKWWYQRHHTLPDMNNK